MVNGMHHLEALKTAQAVVERTPDQLIRESFVAASFPGREVMQYNKIGGILCDASHMSYVRQGIHFAEKNKGPILAVNFARSISGLDVHSQPYIEQGIPFILSSEIHSDYRNSTKELDYIESEVKKAGGLAMLGQVTGHHLPVCLRAIDFMISKVNAGASGEVFRLEDFQ